MEGEGGSIPDQVDRLKDIIRNEPTPSNGIGSMLKNPQTSSEVPVLNEYGEISGPDVQHGLPKISPEQHDLPTKEIKNKDYGQTREEFNSTLGGALALADELASSGDKDGARKILDAALEGKLKDLDSPPDAEEFKRLADKANWDALPLRTKIAIVIATR